MELKSKFSTYLKNINNIKFRVYYSSSATNKPEIHTLEQNITKKALHNVLIENIKESQMLNNKPLSASTKNKKFFFLKKLEKKEEKNKEEKEKKGNKEGEEILETLWNRLGRRSTVGYASIKA